MWDAEVVGGLLALWMLRDSNRISRFPISIYSDSQAFIRSIGAQKAKSGYHLVEQFTNQANSIVEQAAPTRTPEKIKLRWIAAHNNALGNKHADKEAKKATAGTSLSNNYLLPFLQSPLPPSTKTTKANYMKLLKLEWKEKWNMSPRKARFSNIDSEFPLNKFQKIQASLTWPQSSRYELTMFH